MESRENKYTKVLSVEVNVSTIRKVVIALAAIAIVIFASGYVPYVHIGPVSNEHLDRLNLADYNKLMIVAHPDDELLWGGAHLIEDDYLVVCLTSGNKRVRREEFENVITNTEDKGLILAYPDKINMRKSKWRFCKNQIARDLETILNYKDWEEVVTHNEKGEYGHIQHIMTHNLVAAAYSKTDCQARRYFFGDYYVVDRMPDELESVKWEDYKKKREIARNYQSQRKTLRRLYHMMPYELWKEE